MTKKTGFALLFAAVAVFVVLTAVLGIGVWIGRSGINSSVSEKIRQAANVRGGDGDSVVSEDGSGDGDVKSDDTLISPPDINSTRSAKVIRVIDGDTIEIEGGERVRYLGINAPESGQPFSTEATRENERLAAGRAVSLEFDVQTQDRYGRLLAYVWAGDVLVNKEIVKNGYAVSETIEPNVKYQDLIVKAQAEAREACRGLWSGLCSKRAESSCVKIVNINADAPGNDNNNKNGEWIEIKNTCDTAISMQGWLLKDSSASNKYQFGSFTLEGAKSVILYSGCGADSQDKLYWHCPEGNYAIWNNNGDYAFLYDAGGNLAAEYQY
jgi:micrococcal nuclease